MLHSKQQTFHSALKLQQEVDGQRQAKMQDTGLSLHKCGLKGRVVNWLQQLKHHTKRVIKLKQDVITLTSRWSEEPRILMKIDQIVISTADVTEIL